MPTILSKLVDSKCYNGYNCYEALHTWTPNCSEAAVDVFWSCFRETFKMYSVLSLLSQVAIKRRISLAETKKTMVDVVRSAFFVSFAPFSLFTTFCVIKKLSGKQYWTLQGWLPGFIGGLMALFFAKRSRVSALALYSLNLASEIVFRLLVSKGYMRPIPGADVYIFSLSIALLMYYYKRKGYGRDPVSAALKAIVGENEAKPNERHKNLVKNVKKLDINNNDDEKDTQEPQRNSHFNWLTRLLARSALLSQKHDLCPHRETSCVEHILEKGLLKPFFMGWMVQTALMTASKTKKISEIPFALFNSLLSSRSLMLGAFLSSFSTIFKSVNCALRWTTARDRDEYQVLAGLLAGTSFYFYRNPTISLYVAWNCIGSFYAMAADKGYVKQVDLTYYILFAASCSILFNSIPIGCQHIRPSYVRFLEKVSDGRLKEINRMCFDMFTDDSFLGFRDYFPDLSPRFMSRQFMETIFVWLI